MYSNKDNIFIKLTPYLYKMRKYILYFTLYNHIFNTPYCVLRVLHKNKLLFTYKNNLNRALSFVSSI